MHNDLQSLTKHTVAAVRETAAFIRAEMGKVSAGQIEEKHLNGLVSYVDRTAEEMLVESLGRLLPEATFLTEEATVENRAGDLQWIIDPLDGTTNFLYGVPHFSVSVGLKVGDQLQVGVVHHVPADECFWAWRDGGAWCNGEAIRASSRSHMRQALVATGFPYHNFDRAQGWFAALRRFMEQGRGARRFGSAALDLAYVACGRFDIFFEYGLNAWDVAFDENVRDTILNSSSSENPTELSKKKVHSVKLDSRANMDNWKKRLTAEEILRIRKMTESVSHLFYSENEW